MGTPLLQSPLRTRGQVARVRFQAKRIARLLGFSPLEQMEIACRVFDVALEAAKARPRRVVVFELEGDRLSVSLQGDGAAETAAALVVALPKTPEFCAEDIRWMVSQLSGLLKADFLDIVREQNEEIRRLATALRCCEERSGQGSATPSAA